MEDDSWAQWLMAGADSRKITVTIRPEVVAGTRLWVNVLSIR